MYITPYWRIKRISPPKPNDDQHALPEYGSIS